MSNQDDFMTRGNELADFWARQASAPKHRRGLRLFGWPIELSSNKPEPLQAAEHSLPLFSLAPDRDVAPLQVHVVVRAMPHDPGPVPDDLFTRIQYSGHDAWLAMHLAGWGMAHMDLDAGRAVVVVAPALALAPQELSRYVLNTIFLNLLENRGYSLLHATSVARADRVLLLLGPHNSGKSTAALRLALHGYDFIADSLIAFAPFATGLQLSGFPVGRAKLRQDMLQAFPDLFPLFRREITRDEIKFGVDLERLEAVRVRRDAVLAPQTIDIFLLQRHEAVESRLEEIDSEEAMHALFHNSAYWHSAEFWQQNMARLQQLLLAARCRRLHLGTGVDEMLGALDD